MTCGRSPRAAPAFRPPLGPQPGVAFTSVPLLQGDLAGRFNFKPPCLALGAMAAGRLLLIVRIVTYYFIIEVIKCSSGCSFILGTHTNGLVRRHCRALKHGARHGFPLVWGPCARCNSNGRTPHTPTSGTACRATAVSSYDLFLFFCRRAFASIARRLRGPSPGPRCPLALSQGCSILSDLPHSLGCSVLSASSP